MIKIAVIGGGLQGIEVTYLAQKAGYKVILIDKKENVPASYIADESLVCNIFKNTNKLMKNIQDVDLILPATENNKALQTLKFIDSKINIPIIFDWDAYQISSSKIKSKFLFNKIGIPQAKSWPEASFPLIVKPSCASGSKKVSKINNKNELNKTLEMINSNPVIEEYLIGPSYSMEVIAYNKKIYPLVTTYLDFDCNYDCKRVFASDCINSEIKKGLNELCKKISYGLSLEGIMDLEVIESQGQIKVLEIDARFPSQTPSAVYWATKLNMVKLLCDLYLGNIQKIESPSVDNSVIYEQIKVQNNTLKVCGEHILTSVKELQLVKGFFGAEEAITNYNSNKKNWVAILIFVGHTINKVIHKRNYTLKKIINKHSLYNSQQSEIFNVLKGDKGDKVKI